MRKVLLPLLASLAIATPALADEARVEARGGVIWSNGQSQDIWGAAAGYDFDLAPMTFAGVEVSGDKIGTSNTKVAWGVSGRIGLHAATATKVYALAGYTTEPCDLCQGSWHAGAGVQQGIGNQLFLKGEYRHQFQSNGQATSDALFGGVGFKF
ncbi:MAG: hypothetical protein KGM49_07575 [Sphingomonadales bacterium]|nr:hypothetical protein [Sphingomonadales bacterium]